MHMYTVGCTGAIREIELHHSRSHTVQAVSGDYSDVQSQKAECLLYK